MLKHRAIILGRGMLYRTYRSFTLESFLEIFVYRRRRL